MKESANNLYKLLENLLAWTQIQKGAISFTPEELDLSVLVTQNIDSITQTILKKEISINSNISHSVKINADEKMINSVLRNLLSNAVKFTQRGGKILISAKPAESDMIEISVNDSGIGMAEALAEKLFKMSEKVGRRGTEGEESTGLGLLLCKEFVEKHNGRIWAESQEGKGSTFYFTIPALS